MSILTSEPELRQLHKFGGSSLADAACYDRVADIMANYSQPRDLMVVSAAGTTTNQIINWLALNETDRNDAYQTQKALQQYQLGIICGLSSIGSLSNSTADDLCILLKRDIARLATLLETEMTPAQYAEAVGHGEIWSARLMAAVLQARQLEATWLDARRFLIAGEGAQPQVDEKTSRSLLQKILATRRNQRVVITGFICTNKAGETRLLGRNGSDYSATQIGALAAVDRVTIWSDVAGVYSADPRKVKDACLIPLLRLDEVSELARLGAPVLHARTLQPIESSKIDLQLRCSYQPEQAFTRIERILATGTGARIITSHDDVCLIEIKVPARQEPISLKRSIEGFLERAKVKPLATAMQTDRRLLQFCYTNEVASSVCSLLSREEIGAEISLRGGLAMVAVVGAGVCRNPLHTHRFWQQINDQPVEFVWQSENDISLVAVLRTGPTEHLVSGLHQSLFRAEKRIGLVLFGRGNIGSRWLELFASQQKTLSARTDFEFVLAGVLDSERSLLNYNGLDASHVLAFFDTEADQREDETLFLWMREHPYDDLVVLDITASEILPKQYLQFARYGSHVISANKIAGASDSDTWRQIRDAFSKTHRHWLYNATVGASLPVNYTIRDLRESGDTILSISGIFSGTLSWIFLHFDGTVPFTSLLSKAWRLGLTEPDPRTDLSGEDSVRKLVILAREAGYDIEPDQVRVESLIPEGETAESFDEFIKGHTLLNRQMLQRFQAAQELDLLLRYVARFDANGTARVGIEAVRQDHPLATLSPCDNVFAIESRWYRDGPLIVRGPGTGRDVTAGAIQSDINRLAKLL